MFLGGIFARLTAPMTLMQALAATLSSTPDRMIAASTEVMKWAVGIRPGAGAKFNPLDRADTWESWSGLDDRFTTRRFPWLSWWQSLSGCQRQASQVLQTSQLQGHSPVGASDRRGLSLDTSACCSNVVHVQLETNFAFPWTVYSSEYHRLRYLCTSSCMTGTHKCPVSSTRSAQKFSG